MSGLRIVSAGVLAGVYAGNGPRLVRRGHEVRRHALMLDPRGRPLLLYCGKIKLENMADDYRDASEADCPRCLAALRKDTRHASALLASKLDT